VNAGCGALAGWSDDFGPSDLNKQHEYLVFRDELPGKERKIDADLRSNIPRVLDKIDGGKYQSLAPPKKKRRVSPPQF
jgi:hypothetical protein